MTVQITMLHSTMQKTVEMKTHLLWRFQKTKRIPKLPSPYGYGQCVPDEPADEYGWRGYWWAYPVDCTGYIDTSTPLLIRSRYVHHAYEKRYVDLFVPGLWGTVYESAYISWFNSLDTIPRGYVMLYEGEILPEYNIDEWDFFSPIRVVDVLTVRAFLKRFSTSTR